MNAPAPREGVPPSPLPLLQLPSCPALEHTILFYDARVGVLNGLTQELHRGFHLEWEELEILLTLHQLNGSDATTPVPARWIRSEAAIPDSSFHRRMQQLSAPTGWLEKATPGPDPARGGHASVQFSESGRSQWRQLLSYLESVAKLWLEGVEPKKRGQHALVLMAWRQRLDRIRLGRTGSAAGSAPSRLLPSGERPTAKPGSHVPISSPEGGWSWAEPPPEIDPLLNVILVIQFHRRFAAYLANLLKGSSLGLPEADLLTFLGVSPDHRPPRLERRPPAKRVGGWFEYARLLGNLSHTRGMSQPQFSRLATGLSGKGWIEFSWKHGDDAGRTKQALPDAPTDATGRPDLLRKWVRLTEEGFAAVEPIWNAYRDVAVRLCQEIPDDWLAGLDAVNRSLAIATPPLTAWQQHLRPAQAAPVAGPPRALRIPAHLKPHDSLSENRTTSPQPSTPLRHAATVREETPVDTKPRALESSPDTLIQGYLDALTGLGGHATHEELRTLLGLDRAGYAELFLLLRHRGLVSGRDEGLTVRLAQSP